MEQFKLFDLGRNQQFANCKMFFTHIIEYIFNDIVSMKIVRLLRSWRKDVAKIWDFALKRQLCQVSVAFIKTKVQSQLLL